MQSIINKKDLNVLIVLGPYYFLSRWYTLSLLAIHPFMS